jgi:hypothetical protein
LINPKKRQKERREKSKKKKILTRKFIILPDAIPTKTDAGKCSKEK